MNGAALSVRVASMEAAGRAALVTPDRTWTWGELAAAVERDTRRLPRNRTVVFDAPPTAATVIRFLAALESGLCAVPLPPDLPEAERRRRLAVIRSWGDAPRAPRDETPLALVFTSGTGGVPRAVELSRRAFAASAVASATRLGWEPEDRWLCVMPLAHIAGLSIVTRCLVARRTVVLCGRFDARRVVGAIEEERATLASFVPTMVRRLLDPELGWEIPAHLRAVLVGGAPASNDLWQAMTSRGLPALATYGMTETCSQVATARSAAPRDLVPLDGIPIRIREGRIEVGGPTLCSRILDGRDEAPDWTEDGYFRTGDLGTIEGERLRVLGRADDVILTGGHNVSPFRVEAMLETHEAVARALVFGVPDEEWGERVVAVLETARGAETPDGTTLEAWLREHFPSHERPRAIHWVPSLPETFSGKVDRDAARQLMEGIGP